MMRMQHLPQHVAVLGAWDGWLAEGFVSLVKMMRSITGTSYLPAMAWLEQHPSSALAQRFLRQPHYDARANAEWKTLTPTERESFQALLLDGWSKRVEAWATANPAEAHKLNQRALDLCGPHCAPTHGSAVDGDPAAAEGWDLQDAVTALLFVLVVRSLL